MASDSLEANVHHRISETDVNQWDNLVFQSDLGSVFHSSSWLQCVEEGFELEGRHVVVTADGNPVCVFPNFLQEVRLPPSARERLPEFLDRSLSELASTNVGYGGPLVKSDEEKVLRVAMQALRDSVGLGTISHYMNPYSLGYLRYISLLHELKYDPTVTACRFEVPLLGDTEDVIANMHKDRRYDIRSVADSRVEVHEESLTEETMGAFYSVYRQAMDRVDGSTNPLSFFYSLTDLRDEVKIFAAMLDDEVVGRHLCVLDKPQSTIHHLFSAVLAEDFTHNPSEAIHKHTIDWAIDAGFERYDLGPTVFDHRNGLFKYKEKYGGELRPIVTLERGLSPLWRGYRLGRSVYRRI